MELDPTFIGDPRTPGSIIPYSTQKFEHKKTHQFLDEFK